MGLRVGAGGATVSIRTLLKHKPRSDLACGPRGEYCLGRWIFKLVGGVCVCEHRGAEVSEGILCVLGFQSVEVSCIWLRVGLRSSGLYLTDISLLLPRPKMYLR